MPTYVLLTEIERKASEWWADPSKDRTEEIRIFTVYNDARIALRRKIIKLAKEWAFLPFDSEPAGAYEGGAAPGDENIERIRSIIGRTISEPSYVCEDAETLNIRDADDAEHSFAFVGNGNLILADYHGKKLEMNIHDMTDVYKPYFFSYRELDDCGELVGAVSVRLLNTSVRKIRSKIEYVPFGRYIQDYNGEKPTPLMWRLLDKKDGMELLITEKVIEYKQFSSKNKNNWEKSDIRKWLNTEFYHTAFTEQEQALIQEILPGDKVFLISLDEYEKYLVDNRPGHFEALKPYAQCTDYLMNKEGFRSVIEWWFRTASAKNILGGRIKAVWRFVPQYDEPIAMEPHYRSGIRPAIWIKSDEHSLPKSRKQKSGKSNSPDDIVVLELVSAGKDKFAVIKAMKEHFGMGTGEAKEIVDSLPRVIKTGITRKKAREYATYLTGVGAKVKYKQPEKPSAAENETPEK